MRNFIFLEIPVPQLNQPQRMAKRMPKVSYLPKLRCKASLKQRFNFHIVVHKKFNLSWE
jgi:hypothetical protein